MTCARDMTKVGASLAQGNNGGTDDVPGVRGSASGVDKCVLRFLDPAYHSCTHPNAALSARLTAARTGSGPASLGACKPRCVRGQRPSIQTSTHRACGDACCAGVAAVCSLAAEPGGIRHSPATWRSHKRRLMPGRSEGSPARRSCATSFSQAAAITARTAPFVTDARAAAPRLSVAHQPEALSETAAVACGRRRCVQIQP